MTLRCRPVCLGGVGGGGAQSLSAHNPSLPDRHCSPLVFLWFASLSGIGEALGLAA